MQVTLLAGYAVAVPPQCSHVKATTDSLAPLHLKTTAHCSSHGNYSARVCELSPWWRERRPQGSHPLHATSPASTMNALVLIVVVIVEAGEEGMRGRDPCGRLFPFTLSVLPGNNSQALKRNNTRLYMETSV